MAISGPSRDRRKFLADIGPEQFAELVADILALRGHKEICVVDGPGDGCRDIQSVDESGEKHVTQCKVHRNIDQTASSRETGELPIALLKFGSHKGLFATNSRISPQAKREYLEDYPGYRLGYLEGHDIATEVFGNPILRAVWFDGTTISRIATVLRIPLLLRDLEQDQPAIDFVDRELVNHFSARRLALGNDIDCRFEMVWLNSSIFEPYRRPRRKTIGEGWGNSIATLELVVEGAVRLDQVEVIKQQMVFEVLNDPMLQQEHDHLAVRIGQAYLVPLGGEVPGAHIEIGEPAITLVRHGNVTTEEIEWLLPSSESGWITPDRITATTADWFRWYNVELDACLEIGLESVPSQSDKGLLEERKAFLEEWWFRSLFMLIDARLLGDLELFGIGEPTERFDWPDGRHFCCWFHPLLLSPFRPLYLGPVDKSTEAAHFLGIDLDDVQAELEAIRSSLTEAGAEDVEPSIARHMYAVVKADPFPDDRRFYYRSIDLFGESPVPSPIDPHARQLIVTFCWRVGQACTDEKLVGFIRDSVTQVMIAYPRFDWSMEFQTSAYSPSNYILLYLIVRSPDSMLSTADLMTDIAGTLRQCAKGVEEQLQGVCGAATLSTHEYWLQELGILFRVLGRDYR